MMCPDWSGIQRGGGGLERGDVGEILPGLCLAPYVLHGDQGSNPCAVGHLLQVSQVFGDSWELMVFGIPSIHTW
jgi:hypothetical protein